MRLYVNIDHVATLREARKTDEPDPVQAAAACERAGADGITVHLREDRRHIQDADVLALARSVRTVLNLELGAHDEIVRLAARIKPFQATLVPEKRQEITTEGGLALRKTDRRLKGAIGKLQDAGIRVSLFIDPAVRTIDVARDLGVPAIEIHTGKYANASANELRQKTASNELRREKALNELRKAASHAKQIGLAVHAGHGLTYQNVQPVAAIPEIEELNIGHSIVSNAVFWGIEEAVRRMRQLVDSAISHQPSAVSHQPSAVSKPADG
jgi:pyridoxine 5-phosphate synthase